MIIHLKTDVDQKKAQGFAESLSALLFHDGEQNVLVCSSKIKELSADLEKSTNKVFHFDSDIQLASRDYKESRTIQLGKNEIGGPHKNTLVITGPCSVESKEQIEACAEFVSSLGIGIIRAGCFKPRTSPYTFQGLGEEGLRVA